jgi:hypothetical protein
MGSKLGAAKTAAAKIGISVEEYLWNRDFGLKWCFSCKTFLSRDSFFNSITRIDGKISQCKECSKVWRRNNYKQNHLKKRERGLPPKDGDKLQARYRVGNQVAQGKLPHARAVRCTDCGHIGSDRQHEYDHYKGYDAINHLNVQCVCVPCHRKREQQRKEV